MAEVFITDLESISLFDENNSVASLRKGLLVPDAKSAFGSNVGRVPHPIMLANASALMTAVNIQQTCIQTKRDATVGLGFETEQDREKQAKQAEMDSFQHEVAMGRQKTPGSPPAKDAKAKKPPVKKADEEIEAEGEEGEESPNQSKVDKLLDPLCEDGFQGLLNQVGEDYENTGNGYFEIVRDTEGTGAIIGLWHLPAPCVHVVVEVERPYTHYEIDSINGPIKLARFGDAAGMRSRLQLGQEKINEIVPFKQISPVSRYYGMPSWLSCVSWLELAQMMMQYNFDYFQNRAVPDLLVTITGGQVTKEQMKELEDGLKGTVGSGKRHRTVIAQFPNPDLEIQIERLNSDNREKFQDLWSTVQLQIVSAHRVPPLLAGVTLPGKMAAANELPNALIAFQTLYIDQHQKTFKRVLGETLGGESGVPGLTADDFVFKKITDYYDMGQVDTMSRMRETATEAQFRGRDLEDGLKD